MAELPVDHAYPIETCATCKAPIFWATTASTGRPMPIDAQPADDGNVKLTDRGGMPPLAHVVGNPAGMFGVKRRWKSHFATCPQAGAHRRRSR